MNCLVENMIMIINIIIIIQNKSQSVAGARHMIVGVSSQSHTDMSR